MKSEATMRNKMQTYKCIQIYIEIWNMNIMNTRNIIDHIGNIEQCESEVEVYALT
jgi:hypothetical protein